MKVKVTGRRKEKKRGEEVKNLFTELQYQKKCQTILHGLGDFGTKFQNYFPIYFVAFYFFNKVH